MGAFFGLFAVVAVLGGVQAFVCHRWRRALQRTADRLGLNVTGVPIWPGRARGAVGDLHVSISGHLQMSPVWGVRRLLQRKLVSYYFTRIEVEGVPGDLSAGSEGWAAGLGALLADGEAVVTGDADFDEVVSVRGEVDVVRSRLDQATRAAMVRAIELGAKVEDGRVKLEVSGLKANSERLAELTDVLVSLGQALSDQAARVDERLERIVAQDPDPEVADGALAALIEQHPASHATQRAIDGVLQAANVAPQSASSGLNHDRPAVRLATIVRMAEVGVIRDVEKLLAIAEDRHQRRSARNLARQAIAAIQGRVSNASAGGLALSEPGRLGGLSMADAPGSLSAVEPAPEEDLEPA